MHKPNLELYFAIPAIQTESGDWDGEIKRMFAQSQLVRQFVDGMISPADFEDGLADLGHNPDELADVWESGTSLLYL